MSDNKEVLRSDGTDGRPKGTLLPGSARVPGAGRRPGTRGHLSELRAYAEKLCKEEGMPFKSPAEFFLHVGIKGVDPLEGKINDKLGEQSPFHHSKTHQNFVDSNGTVMKIRVGGFVPLETRIDCLRLVAPYLHPKLAVMEITGAEGEPLFDSDRKRAEELSQDPEVRRLLEKVAAKQADITADAGEGREELVS